MHRRSFLRLAPAFAWLVPLVWPDLASALAGYRLSGPFVHDNLAVYLVRAATARSWAPLTLQEAMASGAVRVHETGNVNELSIENLGLDEVFVQAGDIVKGGKQDRVLTVSLVLPPRSGPLAIASFCVERGRWAARGGENTRLFSTSDMAMPSRKAKLAMHAPVGPAIGGPATLARQREVWQQVATIQQRLTQRLDTTVAARPSPTSLQLSLENARLREVQSAYVQALEPIAAKENDIIGYVFAINGRISSGDLYGSGDLFRKMWPKLIRAGATEALGEREARASPPPAIEAVLSFLGAAERGAASSLALPARTRLDRRESEDALLLETVREGGAWIHRSYLAK